MAEVRPVRARPLSPHLQVYRFTLTMAMSIAHRITGCALYVGTIVLVWWLLAAASGIASYETMQWLLATPIGILVLAGLAFALVHHAIGGVRHLIWDMGLCLDHPMREWITLGSLIASIALTVLLVGIGLTLFIVNG